MSVVANDFEALKQYNLAEIHDPSQPKATSETEKLKQTEDVEKAGEGRDAGPP